uniref:Uncharacterized protein n=1 Tax=Arundo donax TaxID=35708 RepID=A0A0A9H094_ARUDO
MQQLTCSLDNPWGLRLNTMHTNCTSEH